MVEDKQISREFEGLIHGISRERIIDSTIHSMMICPMCEHIFWNPQTCSNPDCGRTLCEPCLKRAVEERETCEYCLQATKYNPNPFFVQSFKKLTFKCQNHPKCSEILTYKDLPYHICRHDQMKCPISPECKWMGDREELVEHIPQCPKEIVTCKNEGCGHKHQRETEEEHTLKCMFQTIQCPKLCGFEGRRGQLDEHLSIQCPLVQLECGYIYRGCEYSPVRRDYEGHMLGCLYQPKVVGCGHEVNLGDEEGHCEVCNEFPMPCDQCGYVFTRGGLVGHRCLTFLHGLIGAQGGEIGTLEQKVETQGGEIGTLEQKIETQGGEIGTLEQKIETQGGEIKAQGNEIETQGQKIVTQEQKIGTQRHEIETQGHEIKAQGNVIETQGGEIKAQGNVIQVQGHEIETQGQKIETQELKIETQRHEIETQGQKIGTQEHEIETQNHQIVSLGRKITSQDNKITVLEHIIEGFQPHMVHIKSKYIYRKD